MRVRIEPVNRTTLQPSPLRRRLLTAAGVCSLGLGVVGIFLPLLPTTCFLLLAAACFSKSSPRCHRWLMNNRWFGRYLRQYQEEGVISRKVQWTSIVVLWLGIGLSVFLLQSLWVGLVLLLVGVVVTVHVVSVKTPADGVKFESLGGPL